MDQNRKALLDFFNEQQIMLYEDGMFLCADSEKHQNQDPTDYSYLVFPFAKLYEGFLKDYFLKLGIITKRDYLSDHFRIGKTLSPNLVRRLGARSAYRQLEQRYGQTLPQHLWSAWKEGRNLVFHYFPQNYRVLTRTEADSAIHLLLRAMEEAVSNIR